jgi:beta-ureidopropionase
MANIVKAALLQTDWTGDKESMIDKHEQAARDAAAQGAQVICFQELFYGPYFCQVQDAEYYSYTEYIPDGPTTQRFQSVAKELGMVMVLPMYEAVNTGHYYNTAAVIDADGTYLGKYRKQHIPQVKGFWEKFYFAPGTEGYPIFDTAVGKVGVYICYDRHFPEGWRILGLNGAEIVFNPSATHRGLSSTCGGSSSRRPPWPTCTTSGRSTGSASSRSARTTSTARATSSTRAVSSSATSATRTVRADRARPRPRPHPRGAHGWQFYRDRRPEAYDEITAH